MFPHHLKNRLSKLGDTPDRVSLIHTSPKNKKRAGNFPALALGCPVGFEPTTFGTTIRRSNQLNYGHHFSKALQRYEQFLNFQAFQHTFFSKKFSRNPILRPIICGILYDSES